MSDSLRKAVDEFMLYSESISSIHKRTVKCCQEIKETLGVSDVELQQATTKLEDVQRALNKTPSVLFTGSVNCGKSSIVNEILRQSRLVPVNEIPCTARIVRIKHAKQPYIKVIKKDGTVERMELLEKPRIPNELVAGSDAEREKEEHLEAVVEVGLDHDLLKSGIELIDSPGMNESDALDSVLNDFLRKGTVPLIVYVVDGKMELRPADITTLHCLKNAFPLAHLVYVCNKVITTKEALLHDREPDDSDEESQVERPRAEQVVFQQLQEKHFLPKGESVYSCSKFHGISAKDVKKIRTNTSKQDSSTIEEVTTRFSQFECCLKDNLVVALKKQTTQAIQALFVFYETLMNVIQSRGNAVSQTQKEAARTLQQISHLFGSITSSQDTLAVLIKEILKCVENEVLLEADQYSGSAMHFVGDIRGSAIEKAFNSLEEPVQSLLNVCLAEMTENLMKIFSSLKSPIIFGILKDSYDIDYRAANRMLEVVLEGLLDSVNEAATIELRKQIFEHICVNMAEEDATRFSYDDVQTQNGRRSLVQFLFSKFDHTFIAESICNACNARIQSMHRIFQGALSTMTSLNAAFSSSPEEFCFQLELQVSHLATETYALHFQLAYGPVELGSFVTQTRHASIHDCSNGRWCQDLSSGRCAVKVLRKADVGDKLWKHNAVDLFNVIGNIQRVRGSHPNLLDLYGWTLPEPDVLYIVMEKAEKGLLTALREGLPLPRRMDIALDVARGLAAFHDIDCVHGDLKPESILLMTDGTAKINLAKPKRPHEMTLLGSPFHISPEMYRFHGKGQLSCASCDIYAFGMLMWVLCEGTGEARPKKFQNLDTNQATQVAVTNGVLPERLPAVNVSCWEIMLKSWEHKENLTMESVLRDLLLARIDVSCAAGLENKESPDVKQWTKFGSTTFFLEACAEPRDDFEVKDEWNSTTSPLFTADMKARDEHKAIFVKDLHAVSFEHQFQELTSLLTYFKKCSEETLSLTERLERLLSEVDEPISLKHDVITDSEKRRLQSYAVDKVTLLVVGQTNSGKTSLVNELLGVSCLPTSEEHCTRITHLKFSEKNYIKVKKTVHIEECCPSTEMAPDDGKKRDSVKIQGVMEVGRNSDFLQHGHLEVIDAPGVCDEEILDKILQEFMQGALPVVIYVIDANSSLGFQERRFLVNFKRNFGHLPIYYVCSKVEDDEGPSKQNGQTDQEEKTSPPKMAKQKQDPVFHALVGLDLISRDSVVEKCDVFNSVSSKEVRNARRSNQMNRYTEQFDALKIKLLKTVGRVVHAHLHAGIRALRQVQERVFNSLDGGHLKEDCISRQNQLLDKLKKKEKEYVNEMRVCVEENKAQFSGIVDEAIRSHKAVIVSDAESIRPDKKQTIDAIIKDKVMDDCRQQIMDMVQSKLLCISMASVARVTYSVTATQRDSLKKAFNEVESQDDLVASLVKNQVKCAFFKIVHTGNQYSSFDHSLMKGGFHVKNVAINILTAFRKKDVTKEWKRHVAETVIERIDSNAVATKVSKDIISDLENSHAAFEANLLRVVKLGEAARTSQNATVMAPELAKQMCEVEALSNSLVLLKPDLGARVGRRGHRGTVYEDLTNDRCVAKQLNGTGDTCSLHLFAIRETIRRIPDDLPNVLKPVSLILDQHNKITTLLPRIDIDMYQALLSGRLNSIPVGDRLRMVQGMADACKVCWKNGINHMDLRITNVLLNLQNNAKLNVSKPRNDAVPYPDEKAPFHVPQRDPGSKQADPSTLKDHCVYGLAIILWMLLNSTYCRPDYADTTKVEEVFSAIALKKDVVYFSRWKVPDGETSEVKRQAVNLATWCFYGRHTGCAPLDDFCDKLNLLISKYETN